MGASVTAYWPGITEEQLEEQPGFYNDDKAWGDWMAEREDEPDVLQIIRSLGAGAILTYTTDGVDDSEVEWVTPAELRAAAQTLRAVIREGRPGTSRILEIYARNANNIDSIAEEFVQDLEDIEAIASWSEERGAVKITLAVNW